MPSGVYRLRNAKSAPKSMSGIHRVVPVTDTSGYNEVDFRDDTVLRKDTHPNKWAPNGANPYGPYPVIKGQGYHREMTVVGPRAEEPLKPPKKPGTYKKYDDVAYVKPKPIDRNIDGEGRVRGRQADKSSKSK